MKGNTMRSLLAAFIALLLLAGCAGPAPAATAVPVQPALPTAESLAPTPESTQTSFHSDRYGYDVTFSTEEWVVTETEGTWAPNTFVGTWKPGTDTYSSAQSSDVIIVAAQPVAGEVTPEQWADSLLQVLHDFDASCTPPEATQGITVGGEVAMVNSMTCQQGTYNIIFMSTIHNGMGYWMHTRTTSGDRTDDWPNMEKLLSTWTFSS
jgi:hypothetical protein